MKDHAKAKRIQRDRMRREGYVLKQIWVKPDKWPEIKTIIDKINESTTRT